MGLQNRNLILKIAVCGKMRSGKDTVSDYLVKEHKFTKFAFSDGIHKVGRLLFPREFYGAEKPRKLLQDIGQHMRRVDPNIWVGFTFQQIEYVNANFIVISDLRQPNEWQALKEDGFFIVRVNASDETRLERSIAAGDNFTIHDMQHETEQHIDSFLVDFDIQNDGTLEELIPQIEQARERAEFFSRGLQYYKKGVNQGGGF